MSREIDKLVHDKVIEQMPINILPYSSDIAAAMDVETAISKMDVDTQLCYTANLFKVLGIEGNMIDIEQAFKLIRATPLQRCLAALKAKGVEVEG